MDVSRVSREYNWLAIPIDLSRITGAMRASPSAVLDGHVLAFEQLATREIERAFRGLLDLIRRLPDLLCRGNLARYAEMVGVNPRWASQFDDSFARIDWCLTTSGPRVLELNVGCQLGGFDVSAMFMAAAGRDRLAKLEVDISDPSSALIGEVARGSAAGPNRSIAIVNSRHYLGAYQKYFELLQGFYRDAGYVSRMVALEDLLECELPAGMKLDELSAVHRYYSQEQVQSLPGGRYQRLEELLRHAGIPIRSSLGSALSGSKGALALMWEAFDQGLLGSQEQELIERLIPETRALDRSEEIIAEVLEHRSDWVIKPMIGSGGSGVSVGAFMGKEAWRREVAAAKNHGYVAQRYIDGSFGSYREDAITTVGSFLRDGTIVGGFCRTVPCGHGRGITNLSSNNEVTLSPVAGVSKTGKEA